MLNVFIGNKPDNNIIYVEDINAEFDRLGLTGSAVENSFLYNLERGSFIDGEPFAYIDRFGFKLRTDEMSTGCKAAICVLRRSDKLINLSECGFNAVGMILSWCKTGNIYIPEFNIPFPDYTGNEAVEIQFNNYLFSSLSRFNHYLDSEYPFNPNMLMEGIICLV